MTGTRVLHLQKVAGISGSEAHLLSLLPRLLERGWDIRMLMLHEDESGAWDFARALEATGVPLRSASTMHEAVASAFELAKPGDAVLLSPACASFDMFRNYAHRGDVFAQAARAIAEREGP